MAKRTKKNRLFLLLAVFLVVPLSLLVILVPQIVGDTTVVTSYLANLLFRNNLHEVSAGRFYRSGEMSHKDLQQTIKELGIKTVIDLRWASDEPEADGLQEKDVVQGAGADYYHLRFKSSALPKTERVDRLLELYDSASEPILVHCSSGTHRTGMASAIWVNQRLGLGEEAMREQMSIKYGFFRWERQIKEFFQKQKTLDYLIWDYFAEKKPDESFRQWWEPRSRIGRVD